MKRYLNHLIIAIILIIVLSSCGGRDLSTPSSRLVGHWSGDVLNLELYFSEVDSKKGEGTITVYDPTDGKVQTGKYEIVSEAPEGRALTLSETWPGAVENDIVDYVVFEDGKTASVDAFLLNYVDSKTKP